MNKSVIVNGKTETFETESPMVMLDAAKGIYRTALKDCEDCKSALRNIEARQRQLDDAIQDARLKLASKTVNPINLTLEQVKNHGRELSLMQGEIDALNEAATALHNEHARLESELRGYEFQITNSKEGIWEVLFADRLNLIRETVREIYSAGIMSNKNRHEIQEYILPGDFEDCIAELSTKYGLPH